MDFKAVIFALILMIMIVVSCSSCRVTKYSVTNIYAIGSDIETNTRIKGSEPTESFNGNKPSVDIVPL